MSKLDKQLPRVCCSQKELDELDKKSKLGGISKSAFIRNCIFFTEIKQIDKKLEKQKLFLLNNIANNINQIARNSNIKKSLDENMLEHLKEVRLFIKNFYIE